MEFIYEGLLSITPQQVVMYLVGLLLIYLAIKKEYEPALLLPMASAPFSSIFRCPASSTRPCPASERLTASLNGCST